jgi:hypothetical protein
MTQFPEYNKIWEDGALNVVAIFDVGGNINIASEVAVKSNITIAGQSAVEIAPCAHGSLPGIARTCNSSARRLPAPRAPQQVLQELMASRQSILLSLRIPSADVPGPDATPHRATTE